MKKLLFLLFFPLAVISANEVQAITVNPESAVIQGGSNSSVIWRAPSSATYKVFVFKDYNSTATNALYHVYPNGQGSTTSCLSTDVNFPCFEFSVNADKQLTLNNDMKTAWKFSDKGFVSVESSNLSGTEILAVSRVWFEPLTTIVPDYQTSIRALWKEAIAATGGAKTSHVAVS